LDNETKLLLRNGSILDNDGKLIQRDILIVDGKIAKIGENITNSCKSVDCSDKIIFPGLIDCHVHFRDPGFPLKEDFCSGSSAAAAGGVTTILEMPNTNPATFSRELLAEKRKIAAEKSVVNYGFYIGAGSDNLEEIEKAQNIAGIKVYMNITTGKLLIENDAILQKIFSLPRKVFAVHAESETFKKALHLFQENNSSSLYLCHTTLRTEIELIQEQKRKGRKVFAEVCPHHLLFTTNDVLNLKGYGIMKPALASARDREALWQAIDDGTIDTIATDHAPHTPSEKNNENPAFGVIGVELLLSLLLTWYHQGKLSLRKIRELCCENPARIFGIVNKGFIQEGYDADLVLVDLNAERKIENDTLWSKAKGSPYDGMILKGLAVMTIVYGNIVYDNEEIIHDYRGKEVQFLQGENMDEERNSGEKNAQENEYVENESMIQEEVAELLLDVKAVIINAEKPFRYASGILSPIYCDNRLLLSNAEKRRKIVDYFLSFIEQHEIQFDVIAGVATAGIAWAALLADRLNKPMIYIRSEKKGYGKQNSIEGNLELGQRLLIIEDLVSTGGSSLQYITAVRDAGGIADNCIVIMTYELEESKKNFDANFCTLYSLTNFTALMQTALKNNYVSKEAFDKVIDWNTIPASWGKKHGFE